MLGKRVSATDIAGGLRLVKVPAGPYLVFRASSPSPKDIQDAWHGVYDYFANDRGWARAYQADFDRYSDTGVELYIGVRKAQKT